MYFKLLLLCTCIAFIYAIECPVSKIPQHFPHKKLCSNFYNCYNGKAEILRCPIKMYFDEEDMMCKPETDVDCGNRIRDDNTEVDEDDYGKEICEQIVNGNTSNPRDCTTFYVCSNGFSYKMDCPANLYFNSETNRCDYYYNVNCCEHATSTTEA